jgi:hypothetical protein
MKFTSIWFPGYPMALKEKVSRTLDLWSMILADILPKRVVYWITMRQIGKATMTSQNVPATSLDNVLQNLLNIREELPLEPFLWHESMRYPEDDHSKHVHVNPMDLGNMTPEVKDQVRSAVESLVRNQKDDPNGEVKG